MAYSLRGRERKKNYRYKREKPWSVKHFKVHIKRNIDKISNPKDDIEETCSKIKMVNLGVGVAGEKTVHE